MKTLKSIFNITSIIVSFGLAISTILYFIWSSILLLVIALGLLYLSAILLLSRSIYLCIKFLVNKKPSRGSRIAVSRAKLDTISRS